jgi:hypothetical protein
MKETDTKGFGYSEDSFVVMEDVEGDYVGFF